MNIEKLPSGSYRVRKTINGQSYSFVYSTKPSKTQVEKDIAQKIINPTSLRSLTFEQASKHFFEDKGNVLSPSTIRGYNNNLKGLSDNFKATKLDALTNVDIQREINRLAGKLSPKTCKNYYGFISSVFSLYRPEFKLSIKLPLMIQKAPYVPNNDEARKIISEARGTQYELPILLGCLGMRRSEICALDASCLEGNTLHIFKSMVQNKDDEWIIKNYPKSSASARDIYVPDEIISVIERNGFYKGHPHSISDWMRRKQDKYNMEHFSLHKLRHYFASVSHAKGVADADIQAYGGWQTDHVMKQIYRHATKTSKYVSDQMSSELFQ